MGSIGEMVLLLHRGKNFSRGGKLNVDVRRLRQQRFTWQKKNMYSKTGIHIKKRKATNP
jgi:hypothetical protein